MQNSGNLYKSPGTQTFTSQLPISNTGTFQLLAGTLSITRRDSNGWSFDQPSGTTDISGLSTLSVNGAFHQSGGNFWTEGTRVVTIRGNATFDGGFINLNHGQQGGPTGYLSVIGTIKIQGTTEWDCKVDCTPGSHNADLITGTTVNLAPQSAFYAHGVNVPATGVPAGNSWYFLSAQTALTGSFGVEYLDFNDGSGGEWTFDMASVPDAWYLRS
jgi:hypothetical protein